MQIKIVRRLRAALIVVFAVVISLGTAGGVARLWLEYQAGQQARKILASISRNTAGDTDLAVAATGHVYESLLKTVNQAGVLPRAGLAPISRIVFCRRHFG